jgi:hypothetical protein
MDHVARLDEHRGNLVALNPSDLAQVALVAKGLNEQGTKN